MTIVEPLRREGFAIVDGWVLEVLDALLRPSRLLAACQATRIHPGETAQ